MFTDYVLADPTGNITALVTAPVAPGDKAQIVKEIFKNEPTCEQVGFVEFIDENSIGLEMMGGEFCGNATISAAAYFAECLNMPVYEDMYVNVHVNCIDEPLSVYVLRKKDSEAEIELIEGSADECEAERLKSAPRFAVERHNYVGTVRMPKPELGELAGHPIVHMAGISHMIVPACEMSCDAAEEAVKAFAAELDTEALGIILYTEQSTGTTNNNGRSFGLGAGRSSSSKSIGTNTPAGAFNNSASSGNSEVRIEPLVYVKGSDTLFWEHGCATGSTAMGWYRYKNSGAGKTEVINPGGVITIKIIDEAPQLTGNVVL